MDIRRKQRAVVDALEDVKGKDIVVFDTARMPSMFERVVIASGDSGRQLRALSERVQERLRALGARVYGVEGESGGEWVLVDLGDVVVHIMHPAVRSFYNLEEVWGGRTVRLKRENASANAAANAPPKASAKASKAPAKRRTPARKAKRRAAAPRRRSQGTAA